MATASVNLPVAPTSFASAVAVRRERRARGGHGARVSVADPGDGHRGGARAEHSELDAGAAAGVVAAVCARGAWSGAWAEEPRLRDGRARPGHVRVAHPAAPRLAQLA